MNETNEFIVICDVTRFLVLRFRRHVHVAKAASEGANL